MTSDLTILLMKRKKSEPMLMYTHTVKIKKICTTRLCCKKQENKQYAINDSSAQHTVSAKINVSCKEVRVQNCYFNSVNLHFCYETDSLC